MPSKIFSVELSGLDGHLVEIEVDNRFGLPAFPIVGLPDTAVQEARERVLSAVKNSDFTFPRGKVIVNLAPADLKKVGPRYDLPIAIGVIGLSDELLNKYFDNTMFLGELALDGSVRPVTGILASTEFAKKMGFKNIIVPYANAKEAALIKDITVLPVRTLKEAVMYLQGELCPLPISSEIKSVSSIKTVDMSAVKGQAQAKRALEIAAAGGHNILYNGAPGAGKTFMARALNGILPKMTREEMLEVTKIYSAAGLLPKSQPLITERPFRPVHHTASAVSIVGGGNIPTPGEITLAHRGVLFLDEIAEFPSNVLEVLRQPMEDNCITVSRARATIMYPAQFTLIAAMNPCPCGYYNVEDGTKTCECSAWKIKRYQRKISGPLLDRIDIHLNIKPVKYNNLINNVKGETSKQVRARVEKASAIQCERFKNTDIHKNSEMNEVLLKKFCKLQNDSQNLMGEAVKHFGLSARAYFRIIKLARTIADIECCSNIQSRHIGEALQYRGKT